MNQQGDASFMSNRAAANSLPARPESCLTDEASNAEREVNSLHGQLDDLELRLFGPEPKGVEMASGALNSVSPPLVLATSVKHVRQRLESATGRLSRILGRL